jgi:small subunit ribosomal protein S4
VNGKLVNVPSYLVQVGDVVSVRESSAKLGVVVTSLANSEKRPTLSWLGVEKGEFSLKLNADTVRDELNEPAIREQYVVEYYSR